MYSRQEDGVEQQQSEHQVSNPAAYQTRAGRRSVGLRGRGTRGRLDSRAPLRYFTSILLAVVTYMEAELSDQAAVI